MRLTWYQFEWTLDDENIKIFMTGGLNGATRTKVVVKDRHGHNYPSSVQENPMHLLLCINNRSIKSIHFVEQKKCLWNRFFQVTFFFKSLKLAFWVWTVIEKWNLPCHSHVHHSRVLCLNSSLHFSHDLQWYVPKLIYSYFVTNYSGKWWWWHPGYMLEMSLHVYQYMLW